MTSWGSTVYGYTGTPIPTPEQKTKAALVVAMEAVYESLTFDAALNISEHNLRYKYAEQILTEFPWIVKAPSSQ